ncbi:MAG: DUF5672 family protein [Pedobacter sp.]|nr:DUF5672 family protein [Pedobacter sp.]MDQ8054203.1 DUF5672 family protein [Pedobacter sp.]
MKSCVVVFPLYRSPNRTELAFLENGQRLTAHCKQVIAAPEGLRIDESFGELEKLEVKRFAKHYFEGITGYNQLLLSKTFYQAFARYDYLLIHQADVYLFKDELQFWCDQGYDYIGAPWYRPDKLNRNVLFQFFESVKLLFKKNKTYALRHNKVGNGGLSLRKIEASLKILDQAPTALVKKYTGQNGDAYNEDIFWSLEAPKLANFHIPHWQEAMEFAVEFYPSKAYQFLGGNLPFGCHAPSRHEPEFWRKFISSI